jgi:GABA permease
MWAEGERAPVRMWLFPYLTIAVIVATVAFLVLIAFDPDQQQAIFLSLISALFSSVQASSCMDDARAGKTSFRMF